MRTILRAGAAAVALAAPAAAAELSRTILPIPEPPFTGVIRENAVDSTPAPVARVRAPDGAPNVFLVLSDDVGFGMSSAFGGPVPTPNFEKLAAAGQRYNRFHTTGICSPTRAALLTGRNHHNAGVGYLSDVPAGYPGYRGRISPATATIAETLRLNGYSTAMFGKHHNTPSGEQSVAGPFDNWPTQLGFDYFFGFMGGDVDQWRPNLYRGTNRLQAEEGPPALVEKRLADDAIHWVHSQKAAAPDRPFFIYYATGSTHAPHQAPADWIARFKGKFDQGWDAVREETLQRQIAMGIAPPGTRLTPRPDELPAWSDLRPGQKAFAARSMEVAAAMLAYQDAQLGRVLDELERMGELDRTLVAVILGDNGASGEAGPSGTLNEIGHMQGLVEDEPWFTANIDKLGGPDVYGNYPAGWAWAMNAPLRWMKQYASMLGGVRNGMILAWKGHVAAADSVCAEFAHVNDIAPTILAAAKLPTPSSVYGVTQKPMDGMSLTPGLARCEPRKPRTQYFEIGGKAGLYSNGWFASYEDGRVPWRMLPPTGLKPTTAWSLYNLETDFSQSDDLAAREPKKLEAMIRLWEETARKNNVYPLNHAFAPARAGRRPPPVRKTFDFWGKDVAVPASQSPVFGARSFSLDASLNLDAKTASGVVAAYGSQFGGWSLFLDKGRPIFAHARSTAPSDVTRIAARGRLAAGAHALQLTLTSETEGQEAAVTLSADGVVVATGRVPRLLVAPAGIGEMFDIGRDTGVPVARYRSVEGTIEGDIARVTIRLP